MDELVIVMQDILTELRGINSKLDDLSGVRFVGGKMLPCSLADVYEKLEEAVGNGVYTSLSDVCDKLDAIHGFSSLSDVCEKIDSLDTTITLSQ